MPADPFFVSDIMVTAAFVAVLGIVGVILHLTRDRDTLREIRRELQWKNR